MPVTVIDRIVPKNNGSFPVVGDEHFLGGFRVVADAAARDAIPLQRRTVGMWVKTLIDSKTWTLVGGTGNANWQEVIFSAVETPLATLEPLTVPVDYNDPTAVDPPAGTTFARQAEIDAFLANAGAAAIKHLDAALESLPYQIRHQTDVVVAAGIQRPRPGTGYAFAMPNKCIFGTSYPMLTIKGAPPSQWTARDASLVNLSVSATSTPNSKDPWIDVSGTPFATFDLRGYYAILSSGQAALIHKHTSSRLYIHVDALPAPTTITKIASPSTVLRNSLNDTVRSQSTFGYFPQALDSATLNFVDLKFQPCGAPNLWLIGGTSWFQRVMYDHLFLPGSSNGWSIWTLAVLNLQDCSSLSPATSSAPVLAYQNSALVIQDSYFSGSRWGLYANNVEVTFYGGVVLDNLSYSTTAGAALMLDNSSYLMLYGDISPASKQNEIRNMPANVPGIVMRTNSTNRFDYISTMIFANCLGPCVRLLDGAILSFQGIYGSQGFRDGGGNADVGIDVQGARIVARIDARTTVTGALGDVRMSDGTIWTYANITALGPATDAAFNYVKR